MFGWHVLKAKAAHKRRIYLDYAATTPVRDEVWQAMKPYFREQFGNASAVHKEGVAARCAIEEARDTVAKLLKVRADGIIFTGHGTEANNLAIYGVMRELTETGNRNFSDIEIISTQIEHPSISKALEHLASHGVTNKYTDLDEDGLIDEKHFASLLNERTALVTFHYANSEIGVVQPVKRLTRLVKKFNTEHQTSILTHLDAAQAPLWLPIAMDALGVDLMTLDAGKCYGPKGVGVLARRHGVSLKGVMLGGGQEFGLRAGTENTALIVGCAKALEIAVADRASRSLAVAKLRDAFLDQLLEQIDDAVLNGSREHRIANNINISIPGIDTEFAVVTLDTHGIAASTKSACSGADGGGSPVIRHLTGDEARANSTIRFSLGEETTKREIEKTVEILSEHVNKMRQFRSTMSST